MYVCVSCIHVYIYNITLCTDSVLNIFPHIVTHLCEWHHIMYLFVYTHYSLQVAVLNFSKSFSDYTNPGFVHVDDSDMTLAMTVPHDIVMTDNLIEAHIPIVSVSCFTSR